MQPTKKVQPTKLPSKKSQKVPKQRSICRPTVFTNLYRKNDSWYGHKQIGGVQYCGRRAPTKLEAAQLLDRKLALMGIPISRRPNVEALKKYNCPIHSCRGKRNSFKVGNCDCNLKIMGITTLEKSYPLMGIFSKYNIAMATKTKCHARIKAILRNKNKLSWVHFKEGNG